MIGLGHAALAAALTLTPIATYPMNETSGHVMHDHSGHHYNGHIGDDVTLNGRYYAFPYEGHFAYAPEHIITVNNAALNPGWGTYSVTWRFRTPGGHIGTEFSPNYMQKGQGSPLGGMYKFRATNGRVICLFRGSKGSATAATPKGLDFRDGRWHVANCTRTGRTVSVTVDGHTYMTVHKPTGRIDNDWPLAIAGNSYCTPGTRQTRHCNYFRGDLDWIRISR